MLARDPADGVGQVAESGPVHELGERQYKRRRVRIALHDVPWPIIGCGGGKHLSGGAGNQSATGLEEGAAGRLLPTRRLVPRPMDVGARRRVGRALIVHRTPPYSAVGSSTIAALRAREPAARARRG